MERKPYFYMILGMIGELLIGWQALQYGHIYHHVFGAVILLLGIGSEYTQIF